MTNRLNIYEKLNNEYKLFLEEIKKLSSEEIINKAEEITLKENFVNLSYENYDKYTLKLLLEQDNTLNYLYESWEDCNFSFDEEIDMRIDIALSDYVDELKEEIQEKIESDPNYELIKSISNTLKELNNYDLCDYLKDKFDVKDLDEYDIHHILYSKDGTKYLYDYCDEIRKEQQVNYLKEISVIDSEKINDIEDKILPKLKEIIATQDRINRTKDKNKERDDR